MQQQEWKAPGPGHWRRNDAYMTGAITRYVASLYVPAMDEGSREAMRRYGVLVDHFDFHLLEGRLYRRIRGVGSSEEPRPLPPRALFSSLFVLHPELRYRWRRSSEALRERLWRQDIAAWRSGLRERFRRVNRGLQRVDPRALDDAALREHIRFATRSFHEGTAQHFRHAPAYTFPVGDWVRRACEWTGAEPAEAFSALRGSSPASAATMGPLERLVSVVREVSGAAELLAGVGDARGRLERLCSLSPRVAEAIQEYLDEHGHRLVTGYDLTDWTLHELPHVLLGAVGARLNETSRGAMPEAAEQAAARLRDRVPARAREEFDRGLEEARISYGFRDDDVGPTYLWRAGLLRRALLAAGERLVARDRIQQPEHLFHTEPAEVVALLEGGPGAPSGEELTRRADEHRRQSEREMPLELGQAETPPPLEWLPPACARMMQGFLLYISHLDYDTGPRPASTVTTLGGHAVGGGKYEGRARLVRSPADFEKLTAGDVLVARTTSPAYNVILPLVGAVVTDRGGLLCHAAIVAREFGIPAVVGTGNATERIPDGGRVLVDGDRGTVELRTAPTARAAS